MKIKNCTHSDIDAYAISNDLLYRRDTFSSGWNLDIHIGAIDNFVQPLGSLNRALSVIGQSGGHFHRYISISTICLVINGFKELACILDVLDN